MSLQDKIKNAKKTSWPLENWKTIDSLAVLAQGLDCMGDIGHAEDIRQAIDIMRKHQKMQADYEKRLKADMVATLTDIQSEFKEGLRCKGCCNNCVNACEDIPAGWFLDFIDAKINSLKESTDGTISN